MVLDHMPSKQVGDVQGLGVYGGGHKVCHLDVGIYDNQDAVELGTVSEEKICDEVHFNVGPRFLGHW